MGLYDAEEEARRVWNTRIKYEVKQAEIVAEKKAKKKKQQEIAKNMLKENIDISIIIKCTGLTKEEIELL